jgi:hypothetical protein
MSTTNAPASTKMWACPPEWDLTPAQYSRWRNAFGDDSAIRRKDGSISRATMVLPALQAGAIAGGGSAVWGSLWWLGDHQPGLATMLAVLAAFGSLFIPFGLTDALRHASAVGGLAALPADHADRVLPVPFEKAEALSFDIERGYSKGTRAEGLQRAWAMGHDYEKQLAIEAVEAERRALAAAKAAEIKAADDDLRKQIALLEKSLQDKILLDNPAPDPTPTSLELIRVATERHDRVREAYIEIITDPLNALEHASLFDVGDERTSKFTEAYIEIEDFTTIHRRGIPTRLAGEYAKMAREVERLWDDAYDYSTKRSYTWLPDGQADIARKAAAALARSVPADGEEITPEQIISARKALDLLDKITAISLPRVTRGAVADTARLAIEA